MSVKDLKAGYNSEITIVPTKTKGLIGGLFGKKTENDARAINQVFINIKQYGNQILSG